MEKSKTKRNFIADMASAGFRINDIESDIQNAEKYAGHAKGFPRKCLRGNYVLVRINTGKRGLVVGSYAENNGDCQEAYSWEIELGQQEIRENM